MHQIPRRRNRKIQMWIVRQNRSAGRRMRARNRPRVRSRLRRAGCRRRKQKFHFRAIARLQHMEFIDLRAPAGREFAIHFQPREHRVGDGPRTRIVAQQRKLQGQPRAVRFDILVNPAGERRYRCAIVRGEPPFLLLRDAPHRKRRDSRSVSTAAAPAISANSPAARRRNPSICHRRSCAIA